MAVIEIFVDHFLPFIQSDTHNPKGGSVTDVISITDIAKNYKIPLSEHSFLHLGHTVSVRTSVYNVSASNYFELHQQGAKGYQKSVIDIFAMWQEARVVEYESITHNLSFLDSVLVH